MNRIVQSQGRPRSALREKEFIARVYELRKTLTWDQVAKVTGVSKRCLQKLTDEEGMGAGEFFKPRVLLAMPPMDFRPDELAVRN